MRKSSFNTEVKVTEETKTTAEKAKPEPAPKAVPRSTPKTTKTEKKVGLKGIVNDLKVEGTNTKENVKMAENTKTTDKIKSDVFADLEEMQQLMKDAAEGVTANVEKVHQKLVSLPASYLGQIKPLEKVSKDVQEIQEKTLGQAYDLIRTINTTFNDLTRDIITKTNKNLP
jgi:hypothetical protein